MLLSLEDPWLTYHFLLSLPGQQAVVATRECDPQGEDHLIPFPLSVPVWIIGSIVVLPASYLEDRPTLH